MVELAIIKFVEGDDRSTGRGSKGTIPALAGFFMA
jgi:hypothetical protein